MADMFLLPAKLLPWKSHKNDLVWVGQKVHSDFLYNVSKTNEIFGQSNTLQALRRSVELMFSLF